MQQIFRYLSEHEEYALLNKGGILRFARGEVIIEEGGFPNALYIIKKGRVAVEKDEAGVAFEVSRLGEGEVFGELSFLEHIPATATVIADDDTVEVYVIEREFIDRLLESNMGFFGRFYKSLAEILSHRLRDTSVLAAGVESAARTGSGSA